MSWLDGNGLLSVLSALKPHIPKVSANGAAEKAASIPWAKVDSTSTSTAYTATAAGITELQDGVCVMLMNGVVTSESGFTVNINGLGAKPVYSTLSAASRATTLFNVNYTLLLVYNSQRVSGGCWDAYYGYDSNTNTVGYQLRTNALSLPMSSVTYRYRLLFTSADNSYFVPANNSTSTNATATRAVCQEPINPFGRIVYYGTTASVAAGSRPSASYLWSQYTVTLGYSFNNTGAALSLMLWSPVYIKCAPQADGSAIIDSTTPFIQALPNYADGKIYIFLGIATSATVVEIVPEHPVYYHNGSEIRLWTGVNIPTKTSELTNDSGYLTEIDFDDRMAIPAMYATDATSKSVINNVLGADVNIITPASFSNMTLLMYFLSPRTWFAWMNGTELELARLGVSVNVNSNTITLYLRGRQSIATGTMGVDSAWTVSALASDAEGVAY